MKHKLYCRSTTLDGHEAHIYQTRNAYLLHRYIFTVQIFSQDYYRGFRKAVIYGWTGTDPQELLAEIQAWTAHEIFRVNPYLKEIAAQAP